MPHSWPRWFSWIGGIARGACLLAVIFSLSWPKPPPLKRKPDTTRVQLGSPQVVNTTDPRLCVHTRLTDEVEEVKIRRTLEMVREMGASSIVEFFPWAYVEMEEGSYDWNHPDRIIRHAHNQGLKIIARLGFVPAWARADSPDPTSLNYLPENRYQDFARFVGAFVARYQDEVQAVIIWNEPNLNFEWGSRLADPISYARLLQVTYTAAHQANPDIIVLGGALAPTLAPPGGETGGWDDVDYLRQMYEARAGAYFDGLAVHSYGFTEPPQAEPSHDKLNFRRIELLREVMQAYGDTDKPMYITETGWNDHPRWVYGVSPSQRIGYTLDMLSFTRTAYPWVQSVCLWVFRYPAPTRNYHDYFTLLTSDFTPKPVYIALQAYSQTPTE